MKVDGGCHCGAVTFRADVDPDGVFICHCTDCQTISGTAYRTIVRTSENAFELLSGVLKPYVKTAESGNPRVQMFCPECGVHIYATSVGDGPKAFGIRTGTLNQRGVLIPKSQYWCRSAQPWAMSLPNIQSEETQ